MIYYYNNVLLHGEVRRSKGLIAVVLYKYSLSPTYQN